MSADKNLEKELKYALSAKAYRKLLAGLRPIRVSHQQNVYFDDSRLSLRRRRFGLRVRIEDGKKAVLAVKFSAPRPRSGHPAAFKVRHELETGLSVPLARRLIRGKKKIGRLAAMPMQKIREIFPRGTVDKLRPLGTLATERTIVPFTGKLKLEIDRCEVLGKWFHELEVETSTPARTDRQIRTLLRAHGIAYRPLRRSKQARVFSEIRARQRSR